MSKTDRQAVLSDLTSRIFSSMMYEIALDTTIQAQKEERRTMSLCKICGMRCNGVHEISATAPVPGSSRAPSPLPDGSLPGTSTPGGTTKPDGNINLECTSCQRAVASNRYAQHLATCLGVGTGVRRTAQRNAVTKTKTNANNRSGSPYVDDVDDSKSVKGKSKSKAKGAGVDDEGVQKQPMIYPSKKSKKGKRPAAAAGIGPPRLPGSRLGPPGSNPKPSKLRSTPTPSVASLVSKNSHSPSAVGSDSSDVEGGGNDSGAEGEGEGDSLSLSRSHSSVVGGTSPSLPAAETIGRGRSKTGSFTRGPGSSSSASKPKKVTGTGPPAKKPPPPPHHLPSLGPPPPPPVRRPESNFLIDIEGEETGSDTD